MKRGSSSAIPKKNSRSEIDGFHTITLGDNFSVRFSSKTSYISIVLPIIPNSENNRGFRDHTGMINFWAKPASEKKRWKRFLDIAKNTLGDRFVKAETKKQVDFIIFWPPGSKRNKNAVAQRTRLPDKINIANGLKPVLDTLKKLGFIKEDNTKWLDDRYSILKATEFDSSGRGRTEIRIVDAED